MKKILPVIFSFFVLFFFVSAANTHATGPTPIPDGLEGNWVPDPEVTFVGKTATRSDHFLNWTLQNYNWLCVKKVDNGCDNSNNPLRPFWQLVASTVYALMFLFVLATGFIMIITRGQNITIMRFAPRFILLVVLVTLSFSLVQFLYQVVDIIQGFLLRPGGTQIGSADLLHIDFQYKTFSGFRKLGAENDESAFITLLLVKLTAITYYVMTGILLVRKIILWFFLIVSPIFPLLILYRPIRNTAKIWVGEFFRWLLYAPLFALFLHGLVVMWRTAIPMPFDWALRDQGQVVYPTAVNILIGGPGQVLSDINSVSYRDTFAQYVVALIMLWVVILLPFLLLRIFLDYLSTISLSNSMWVKQAVNRGTPSFLKPRGPSPGPMPPPPPPGKVFPTGMARALPFMKKAGATLKMQQPKATTTHRTTVVDKNVLETNQVLKDINISIPKMQDIAKYETAILSRDVSKTQEVAQYHETLEKIANPNIVSAPVERERFSQIKERLVQQTSTGNQVASNVLHTVNNINTINQTNITQKIDTKELVRQMLEHIAKPSTVVLPSQREKVTEIREKLTSAQVAGDPVAVTVLKAADRVADRVTTEEQKQQAIKEAEQAIEQGKQQGNDVATQVDQAVQAEQKQKSQVLPVQNKVQQVSIEEFEEVRKMWVENYENLEPPRNINGEQFSREEWMNNDINKINEAISLLNSSDEQQVNEGMQAVSGILPFLLLGGFSKSEVITYLKAKLEAAKEVMSAQSKKQEEEETMLSAESGHAQKSEEMAAEREIDEPKQFGLEDSQNQGLKDLSEEKTLEGDNGNSTNGNGNQ